MTPSRKAASQQPTSKSHRAPANPFPTPRQCARNPIQRPAAHSDQSTTGRRQTGMAPLNAFQGAHGSDDERMRLSWTPGARGCVRGVGMRGVQAKGGDADAAPWNWCHRWNDGGVTGSWGDGWTMVSSVLDMTFSSALRAGLRSGRMSRNALEKGCAWGGRLSRSMWFCREYALAGPGSAQRRLPGGPLAEAR